MTPAKKNPISKQSKKLFMMVFYLILCSIILVSPDSIDAVNSKNNNDKMKLMNNNNRYKKNTIRKSISNSNGSSNQSLSKSGTSNPMVSNPSSTNHSKKIGPTSKLSPIKPNRKPGQLKRPGRFYNTHPTNKNNILNGHSNNNSSESNNSSKNTTPADDNKSINKNDTVKRIGGGSDGFRNQTNDIQNRQILEYNETNVENPLLGYPMTPGNVSLKYQLLELNKEMKSLEEKIARYTFQLNTLKNAEKSIKLLNKGREKYLLDQLKRLEQLKQEKSDSIAEKNSEILNEQERYIDNFETPPWVILPEKVQLDAGQNSTSLKGRSLPLSSKTASNGSSGHSQVSKRITGSSTLTFYQVTQRIDTYNATHPPNDHLYLPVTDQTAPLINQLLDSKETIHRLEDYIIKYRKQLEITLKNPSNSSKEKVRFWMDRIKCREDTIQKERKRLSELLSQIESQ